MIAFFSLLFCAVFLLGGLGAHRIWERNAARKELSLLLSERRFQTRPAQESVERLIEGSSLTSWIPSSPIFPSPTSAQRDRGRKLYDSLTQLSIGQIETALEALTAALPEEIPDNAQFTERLKVLEDSFKSLELRRSKLLEEKTQNAIALESLSQRHALSRSELRTLLGLMPSESTEEAQISWYSDGVLLGLPAVSEIPDQIPTRDELEALLGTLRPAEWKPLSGQEFSARMTALKSASAAEAQEFEALGQARKDQEEVESALSQTEAQIQAKMRYLIRDLLLENFPGWPLGLDDLSHLGS